MIIGFTCGAFDLLHAGHLAMLEESKRQCDWLTVGLHTDPSKDRPEKNKPVQSMFERYYQLSACKAIDTIIPYDTELDLENMMGILPINKRFVGADHINDYITGHDIMKERSIKVVYTGRHHTYSSSELRERILK
jgi:glycerol-3-phosphate cytidylyltransferase